MTVREIAESEQAAVIGNRSSARVTEKLDRLVRMIVLPQFAQEGRSAQVVEHVEPRLCSPPKLVSYVFRQLGIADLDQLKSDRTVLLDDASNVWLRRLSALNRARIDGESTPLEELQK
jgi:hypothetical protein